MLKLIAIIWRRLLLHVTSDPSFQSIVPCCLSLPPSDENIFYSNSFSFHFIPPTLPCCLSLPPSDENIFHSNSFSFHFIPSTLFDLSSFLLRPHPTITSFPSSSPPSWVESADLFVERLLQVLQSHPVGHPVHQGPGHHHLQ